MTEQFENQETEEVQTDEIQADDHSADIEETGDQSATEEKPDSFPRDYVEKLRDENAKYRQRAQQSDQLAQRLHTALVEATGALQDPSDLEIGRAHV